MQIRLTKCEPWIISVDLLNIAILERDWATLGELEHFRKSSIYTSIAVVNLHANVHPRAFASCKLVDLTAPLGNIYNILSTRRLSCTSISRPAEIPRRRRGLVRVRWPVTNCP